MRNNDSFCDVTIAVKDKEFKAHRAVLAAASPFFLTLLTSNMKESNEQLIKVELEEATETVMEDALKYLYTGNVTVVEDSLYCGHYRDLEVVSSLARVRNSESLFQSNDCSLFLPGI